FSNNDSMLILDIAKCLWLVHCKFRLKKKLIVYKIVLIFKIPENRHQDFLLLLLPPLRRHRCPLHIRLNNNTFSHSKPRLFFIHRYTYLIVYRFKAPFGVNSCWVSSTIYLL
ncbi:hypothetical protein L9F63_001001, partial [Diploptera punctata]